MSETYYHQGGAFLRCVNPTGMNISPTILNYLTALFVVLVSVVRFAPPELFFVGGGAFVVALPSSTSPPPDIVPVTAFNTPCNPKGADAALSTGMTCGCCLLRVSRSAASMTALMVSCVPPFPFPSPSDARFDINDTMLDVNRMHAAARSLLLMRYATMSRKTPVTDVMRITRNSVVRKKLSSVPDACGRGGVENAFSGGGLGRGGAGRGG